MIRNDPAFQSEYNYKADHKIVIPRMSIASSNDISGEDEFKKLIMSSQYSIGSNSINFPGEARNTDKSSAVHVRNSKYTVFPNTIQKPKSRDRISNNLFNAGESVISNSISISHDRQARHSLADRISGYAHKSSEIYPSASTAHGTNSTMIRIRGKNNMIMNKQGAIDLTSEEEIVINAKRKDVAQAAERLRKLENMEKKRIGKIKDQIVRLEEERKRDEDERKLKKKELIERKRQLLKDRKLLEIKKQQRLDNDPGAVKRSMVLSNHT